MTSEHQPDFLGNAFISGDAQRRYYETREEVKNRPELTKLFIISPSDSGWLEAQTILLHLILKRLEGPQ